MTPLIVRPAGYASDLGISKPNGSILLAIMNGKCGAGHKPFTYHTDADVLVLTAASVPGLLILGYLSDKAPLRAVISLSCFGSALSCIFLWGFATNSGALVAFVVLFGFLGLSFSALWTKLITVIARKSRSNPHPSTAL